MQILNRKEIEERVYGRKGKTRIVVGIIAGIVAYCLALEGMLKYDSFLFAIAGVAVLILTAYFLATTPKEKHSSGKFKYECKLDPNESILAIEEKYDIIEQYGDIFILEDK